MKLRWLVVGILVCAGIAGCAANKPAPPVAPTIVTRDATVATILAFVLRAGQPSTEPPPAEAPETALFDEHGRPAGAAP